MHKTQVDAVWGINFAVWCPKLFHFAGSKLCFFDGQCPACFVFCWCPNLCLAGTCMSKTVFCWPMHVQHVWWFAGLCPHLCVFAGLDHIQYHFVLYVLLCPKLCVFAGPCPIYLVFWWPIPKTVRFLLARVLHTWCFAGLCPKCVFLFVHIWGCIHKHGFKVNQVYL